MANKKEVEVLDTYTKEQIISAKRYEDRNDVISVILKDDKRYTLSEVDELIEKFMKGKVK